MSSMLIKFMYLNITYYGFRGGRAYSKILLICRIKLYLPEHSWWSYKLLFILFIFFSNLCIKHLLCTKHCSRCWEYSSKQNKFPSTIALHSSLGVGKFLSQRVRKVNTFGFAPRLSFAVLNLALVVKMQP